MTSQIRQQVIVLILEDKLNATQIAKIVGCHSGYVRAIKVQMLHPDRELERVRRRNRNRVKTPEFYVAARRRAAAYRRRRKAMRVSELAT